MSLKSSQEARGKKSPQHPSTCIEKLNILKNKSKNHVFKRFRELQSSVESDLNTTPSRTGDLAAALSWQSFLMLVQARESVLGPKAVAGRQKNQQSGWSYGTEVVRPWGMSTTQLLPPQNRLPSKTALRWSEGKKTKVRGSTELPSWAPEAATRQRPCAARYRGWENKCDHSREITVALTSGCMGEVSEG